MCVYWDGFESNKTLYKTKTNIQTYLQKYFMEKYKKMRMQANFSRLCGLRKSLTSWAEHLTPSAALPPLHLDYASSIEDFYVDYNTVTILLFFYPSAAKALF